MKRNKYTSVTKRSTTIIKRKRTKASWASVPQFGPLKETNCAAQDSLHARNRQTLTCRARAPDAANHAPASLETSTDTQDPPCQPHTTLACAISSHYRVGQRSQLSVRPVRSPNGILAMAEAAAGLGAPLPGPAHHLTVIKGP